MSRFVRLIDLETTGSRPPAHAVVEIGWQDVVEGADGVWFVADPDFGVTDGHTLVDPGRAIPAVTQAIHHIIDADVAGAPLWSDAAPPVLKPDPRPLALAAHRASFEKRYCTPELTGGADWICTWKSALRLWPDSPSFSNQVLRYWRKPGGLERERGLPVHRAFPDAYVSAHHLRDQLNEVGPERLIGWEREPGLLPRVPYGADKGTDFDELSDEVLRRMTGDRNEDVRFTATTELAQRGEVVTAPTEPPQGELL